MEFACGGLAGVVEVATSHPLDVCKTRLQAGLPLRFNRATLYSGAVPRLIGVVPMRVVFWGSSFWLNKHLPIEHVPTKAVAAGALAGTAQTLLDTPIEVMKIRAIAGAEVAASVHRGRSVTMFSGFAANLFRNVGFAVCMCFFTFGVPAWLVPPTLAPGVGAFVGSVCTQPLDTIKTLQQSGQPVPPLRDMSFRMLMSGTGHRAGQGVVAMVTGGLVMRWCEGLRSGREEGESSPSTVSQ